MVDVSTARGFAQCAPLSAGTEGRPPGELGDQAGGAADEAAVADLTVQTAAHHLRVSRRAPEKIKKKTSIQKI